MAETSRRGAVRKPGSKKGALKGTGGHGRKALAGKGPTPKAEDRTGHPAQARKRAAEKRAAVAENRQKRAAKRYAHLPRIPAEHELVAGRNPVAEAVRAGLRIERVFLGDGVISDKRLAAVVQAAAAAQAPLVECSKADLDRLTGGANHQGIAIEVGAYAYLDAAELYDGAWQSPDYPLIVALDGVTDPHNLGAVIRSAGAFGAHGIVIPTRRSASVNVTAWKVSAGAAAFVPVAKVANLTRAIKDFQERGGFVVGLDGGGDVDIAELQLADTPLMLVTGAEGSGLSRLVRETCDQIASVPISAQVESLNAAVATGIALYQIGQLRRLT